MPPIADALKLIENLCESKNDVKKSEFNFNCITQLIMSYRIDENELYRALVDEKISSILENCKIDSIKIMKKLVCVFKSLFADNLSLFYERILSIIRSVQQVQQAEEKLSKKAADLLQEKQLKVIDYFRFFYFLSDCKGKRRTAHPQIRSFNSRR